MVRRMAVDPGTILLSAVSTVSVCVVLSFFFSSRRRHTRFDCDWSSDVCSSDLAHTLRLIQQQGRDVFYKGEIARAIVAKSAALGGTMTLEDLANYQGEWVTPA